MGRGRQRASPHGPDSPGQDGGRRRRRPGPGRTGSLPACGLPCRLVRRASLTSQGCPSTRERRPDRAFALCPERGARPVTSFVKNLSALSDWYSVYTSAIAFTVSAPVGRAGRASSPRDPRPGSAGRPGRHLASGSQRSRGWPRCSRLAVVGGSDGPARGLRLHRGVHSLWPHFSLLSRMAGEGRARARPGYGARGWLRTRAR